MLLLFNKFLVTNKIEDFFQLIEYYLNISIITSKSQICSKTYKKIKFNMLRKFFTRMVTHFTDCTLFLQFFQIKLFTIEILRFVRKIKYH